MNNHSNRSRASSAKRKGRTILGGGSIRLYAGLHASARVSKAGKDVAVSRIPKAWSDTHVVKPVVNNGYASEYISKALTVRAPFNPNRVLSNIQTLRCWDPAKRKFIAKRIQIGKPGSTYQAPVFEYVVRGNPTLFDACVTMPHASHTRKHIPSCEIGAFDSHAATIQPVVKRSKLEADMALSAWRAAKQQAFYLALVSLVEGSNVA